MALLLFKLRIGGPALQLFRRLGLLEANFTLYFRAHARHLLYASLRRRQFTTTKGETVSIFILLIKADFLVFLDFSISSSLLENNKNKIRESGNF